MVLDSITWSHIISFAALGISVIVLIVTIYFSTKNLSVARNVLNVSKQQIKQNSYFQVIDIVNKSKKGYDAFSEIRTYLDSYKGILVDDEVRKFIDDRTKEINEFENEKSPYKGLEPEERQYTQEEIDQILGEQQEEIESMGPDERYEYDFNQKFGNTKKELLGLVHRKMKEMTEKIDE